MPIDEGFRPDATGVLDVEILVWRFLPIGADRGYVDCAIGGCVIYLDIEVPPRPVELEFEPGGTAPVAAKWTASPTNDLAPGDLVTVQGAHFVPGQVMDFMLCSELVERRRFDICAWVEGTQETRVAADGSFTAVFRIPARAFDPAEGDPACAEGDSEPCGSPAAIACDGEVRGCALTAVPEFNLSVPPRLAPTPLPVWFLAGW